MEEKNINDFLRDKMSFEKMEIEEPRAELVNEARNKVSLRGKSSVVEKRSLGWLLGLLNFRIKLYQSGIATLLIAGMVFYFTEKGNPDVENTVPDTETDSTTCSSLKANVDLVRTFSSYTN
jgi:hypothetical protein